MAFILICKKLKRKTANAFCFVGDLEPTLFILPIKKIPHIFNMSLNWKLYIFNRLKVFTRITLQCCLKANLLNLCKL